MFYDLNVDVPIAARPQAAQTCARLGYDVIAFNTTVNSRKLGQEHLPVNFVPDSAAHALPYDPQLIRVASANSRGRCTIRVLQRITLQIEDVSQVCCKERTVNLVCRVISSFLARADITPYSVFQLPCLSSPVLNKYDIVAVSPASEKILQQCLQFDVDVICLPFTQKHNFHLKRPQLHVAKEKVRTLLFAVTDIATGGSLPLWYMDSDP
jgi:RNase P/RNase MRP subunit p30